MGGWEGDTRGLGGVHVMSDRGWTGGLLNKKNRNTPSRNKPW